MKIFGTDYDGVIINIEPQKARAFGAILNKYWKIDKQEVESFWHKTGGTSRKYKFDYFYTKQFNKKLPEMEYQKIESEYNQFLREHIYPDLYLLPGALELLKFARSNFDHTFISTGMPTERINFLVKLNHVSEYFDLILGTDDEFPSKTEHFKKAVSEWNPDEIIFVADSAEDMKIAKKANAIPIGILTNRTKRELIKGGAETTCHLQDAVSVIKKFM